MSLQSWFDPGQNQESGRSGWWGRPGSSASVDYATATAADGGHVPDGGSAGGGATRG